ncbi:MAG: hypothetical protein IT453_13995 [Planctomycetes bacterium]|nr:hypothetical protein [Planctomycetota bacterium]
MELLMVMLILGVLFGLGVGTLASLDLGKRAARGALLNVIRSARTSAVARGAGARVRFDAAASRVSAEGVAVLGTWHFERDAKGAALFEGDNKGGKLIDEGFIGHALSFAGAPAGSTMVVAVHQDAAFEFSRGFTVECALRWTGTGSGRPLNLGNVVGLEITNVGSVRGWFIPTAQNKTGGDIAGGRTAVESEPGVLPRDAWARIKLDYDRRVLRLFVDDVEVARTEETGRVWRLEGPLRICDPKAGFPGAIDRLVISAVTSASEYVLPETLKFDDDVPDEIRFAPGGYLDRELHAQPVVFHLIDEAGERQELRIGLYGTVE